MTVAGEFWLFSSANMGGSSNSAPSGDMYSLNPQVVLNPGATYYSLAESLGEADVKVVGSEQPMTLTGSPTAGDIISVTVSSSSLSGSSTTVSYTVGASEPLSTIAYGLKVLIDRNSTLQNAGFSSAVVYNSSSQGTLGLNIYCPFPDTFTVSSVVSGSGSETFTMGGSFIPGASTRYKSGVTFGRLIGDSTPAFQNSFVIGMAASPSDGSGNPGATVAAGWQYGLLFHEGGGSQWPFAPKATLIGAIPQVAVGGLNKFGDEPPQLAAYGVDLGSVNFSQASGCSFRSAGFCVNGTGAVQIGSSSISASPSGLLIDAPGRIASAVTIQNGGGGGAGTANNNYYVGDLIYDPLGGQELVSAVNPQTGAVTAISVLVPPYTLGTPPANPLSTTGGSGVGLKLNATWPSVSILQIGATANTILGTGQSYASTATGPFPILPTSAGMPTGSAPIGAIEVDTAEQKVCVSLGSGTWHCI